MNIVVNIIYINKRILNEIISLLSYYRVGFSGYLINVIGAFFKVLDFIE